MFGSVLWMGTTTTLNEVPFILRHIDNVVRAKCLTVCSYQYHYTFTDTQTKPTWRQQHTWHQHTHIQSYQHNHPFGYIRYTDLCVCMWACMRVTDDDAQQ